MRNVLELQMNREVEQFARQPQVIRIHYALLLTVKLLVSRCDLLSFEAEIKFYEHTKAKMCNLCTKLLISTNINRLKFKLCFKRKV